MFAQEFLNSKSGRSLSPQVWKTAENSAMPFRHVGPALQSPNLHCLKLADSLKVRD